MGAAKALRRVKLVVQVDRLASCRDATLPHRKRRNGRPGGGGRVGANNDERGPPGHVLAALGG